MSDAFLVFGLLIMGLNTVRYIYFFYFIASICILKALSSFIKDCKDENNVVEKIEDEENYILKVNIAIWI